MMTQQVKKGSWIEERMLGSGGFGAVHLWKNEETNDRIALKRCRLQNEMTAKHKQRWQLEVQIMQRLNHDNVIAARIVPEPLDVRPDELPLLAMEYCSGGDLRRILNQPQNCMGLKEFSIRCLVQDVAAAVDYLHSKRIIHRDLKPENIVLKTVEDKTVYKVIDLGYAKELDQGSVCTSFVGTLQYLAPELFASQKYTCTVDYWSFGTVVFECISGYRPFLPNSPPVQWHKEVCRKSPEDICVKIDDHGEIKHFKSIPSTNRLSRSMVTYLESWLRMMLRWDPKARGGGLSKENRPTCFSLLDNILNMKIIYVLHVAANNLLTYPVLDTHTMLDLQKRIAEETDIPVENQDIMLANGMTPDLTELASQCWLEPSEQTYFVFLFRHCAGAEEEIINKKAKTLPLSVQAIVRDQNAMIPFSEQKKAWAESVFYCEEQFNEFHRLILSQRAIMLNLLRIDSQFVKIKNRMISENSHLMAKVKYFLESLEHDMMFYTEQVQNGGVSSERMYTKWLKMKEEVENFRHIEKKVTELEHQIIVVQTKIVEMQKSPFARTKQDDTLEDLAKQARNAYQDFRQTAKDNREAIRDQKPMVAVVVKCVVWRDKKVPDLYAHLGKIRACKADIKELYPQVEQCLQEVISSSEKLISFQKNRQSGVWKLVEVAIQQGKKQNLSNPPQNDEQDHLGFCRQEATPSASGNNNNTSSILQSVLTTSSTLESLQVVEDSKVTTKLFEQAMNNMIEEHEEYSSMFTSFNTNNDTIDDTNT